MQHFIEIKDRNDKPMMLNVDHIVSAQPDGNKSLVALQGYAFPRTINMPYALLKNKLGLFVSAIELEEAVKQSETN